VRKSAKKSAKKYLPKPTSGALGSYHTGSLMKDRRKELRRLVADIGYASVMRDLNLRTNLMKNNKSAHDIMKKDMEYLRTEYRS
jgi:hypothetical protein